MTPGILNTGKAYSKIEVDTKILLAEKRSIQKAQCVGTHKIDLLCVNPGYIS